MNKDEANFITAYDISKYERPSVAADIAVFTIMENGESDNFRKLPEKALKILLIRRQQPPYKDCWALPGGFCRPDEDVCETAKRELYEETNVENSYLKLSGVYGQKGRDPRGWIISNTFLALMDGTKCNLCGGTDAWEAKWFTVELNKAENKKETKDSSVLIENEYEIILRNEELTVTLSSVVKENKQYQNFHEKSEYVITDCNGLAFDHSKIILDALLSLRRDVKNNLKLPFDLLPELFTLTQLQNAFELILDEKLLTANFRRKIMDYVIETDESVDGVGYRPAKLFKRNVNKFY